MLCCANSLAVAKFPMIPCVRFMRTRLGCRELMRSLEERLQSEDSLLRNPLEKSTRIRLQSDGVLRVKRLTNIIVIFLFFTFFCSLHLVT